MQWFEPCVIPDGQCGAMRVERFTVSREAATIEKARSFGSSFLPVPEGTYVRLSEGHRLWMSDTPNEIADNIAPIRQARKVGGSCLVAGLGLGLVTEALLMVPSVTSVVVLERSPDVIALVAPTLQARWGDRLVVVEADALVWRPPKGAHYSVAWFDIWADVCVTNWPEMQRIKRRYRSRADWLGCWREATVQRHARHEAAQERQRAAWKALFLRSGDLR